MTLGIGLYAPTWPGADRTPPRWPEIRALARDAESLAIDTLWVADEPGFWECWTLLTAVAAATERIGVGPLVACTRYRNPALLATMVRALDEVSGGRVVLGLGAGQGPRDPRWTAFGYDGDGHRDRFAEAVELVARLVRSGHEPVTFEGRFETARAPRLGATGPRPDGPPIWVAARKPRAMAVAAAWADAVNGTDSLTSPEGVIELREALTAAGEAAGRDTSGVAITGWTRLAPSADGRLDADRGDTIAGSASAIADRLLELHDAGLTHVTCFVGDPDDGHAYPALTRAALDRFAPVVERVRAR